MRVSHLKLLIIDNVMTNDIKDVILNIKPIKFKSTINQSLMTHTYL